MVPTEQAEINERLEGGKRFIRSDSKGKSIEKKEKKSDMIDDNNNDIIVINSKNNNYKSNHIICYLAFTKKIGIKSTGNNHLYISVC